MFIISLVFLFNPAQREEKHTQFCADSCVGKIRYTNNLSGENSFIVMFALSSALNALLLQRANASFQTFFSFLFCFSEWQFILLAFSI